MRKPKIATTDLPKVRVLDELEPPTATPIAIPAHRVGAIGGWSNSVTYELLAARELEAVKRGSQTLVLLESVRAYIARLPRYADAKLASPRKAAKAAKAAKAVA